MLYKEMSHDELRTAYVAARRTLNGYADIAQLAIETGATRTRRRAAAGTGRALRDVEMIEAIARRKGWSL